MIINQKYLLLNNKTKNLFGYFARIIGKKLNQKKTLLNLKY